MTKTTLAATLSLPRRGNESVAASWPASFLRGTQTVRDTFE